MAGKPGDISWDDRRHKNTKCESGRTVAERDRDRILYTSALRRLAGVTQVVAPEEGHVVHNRLTHVIEVAHIARRLAERLLRASPEKARIVGGLNPDIAEAAAYAHDLGHPPFGHVAEEELDRLVVASGVPDGFEGNAQSFRIVTKLAVRRADQSGLDLSRGTLNAILKYPWRRQTDGKKNKKFGYYATEQEDFDFARTLHGPHKEAQSIEARIMDLADDIAYSVSDLEDFVRSGRIPFDALAMSDTHSPASRGKVTPAKFESEERRAFLESAGQEICKDGSTTPELLRTAFDKLLVMFPIGKLYNATRTDRGRLRKITGTLMGIYITDARIDENAPDLGFVVINRQTELEIALLKQLTWHYVIKSSSLAIQQESQKRIIRGLFETFRTAALEKEAERRRFLPNKLTEQIAVRPGDEKHVVRCVADFIAGMSDDEAVEMYQKLHGEPNR